MSELTCPACGAKSGDGLLCSSCLAHVRADLETIAALLPEVGAPLQRLGSGGGSAGYRSTVPITDAVSDARSVVGNDLVTWARELDMGDLDVTEHADLARWLAARVQRIRSHTAADEIADAFYEDARLVSRLTDRRPDRRPVGQCACGKALTATLDASTTACSSCGTTYDVAGWVDARMDDAEDYWLTRDEIVTLLGVNRGTLRSWIHRELTPDADGRLRIGDVRRLMTRSA